MTRLRRAATGLCAAVLLGALAACTNDPVRQQGFDTAQTLATRTLATFRGEPPAGPELQAAREPAAVQAVLAQLPPGPVIRLELPLAGQSAFAVLGGVNRDTVTFLTFSRQSVTFRGGAVVATRGFVFDLMGADLPDGLEARIARRAQSRHHRSHRYLGSEDRERAMRFDCVLVPEAAERVELVSGAAHATTRMRETCESATFTFNNLYWVTAGGAVVQTSQWISRELGEMHVQILRR